MNPKDIPILSQTIKTIKTSKMPDIVGFVQAMENIGARVSKKGSTVVIDFSIKKEGEVK